MSSMTPPALEAQFGISVHPVYVVVGEVLCVFRIEVPLGSCLRRGDDLVISLDVGLKHLSRLSVIRCWLGTIW